MSFLKQILSPFVEFEQDKKKEQEKLNNPSAIPTISEQTENHPLVTGSDTTVAPPLSSIVSAIPEHEQYFEKLIDDANTKNPLFQGTDYKEFIDSKSDIDNIADEETKYKTAFNVLKRTGLTKENLISTAHEYHNMIGRDLNAFQSAHAKKYRDEVQQKETLIQKKAEELQALSAKINALKKEISHLSQELTDTKEKLNHTKNSFLLAGEKKQKEIQDELQKIERYF